jgi:hypothetical protein
LTRRLAAYLAGPANTTSSLDHRPHART